MMELYKKHDVNPFSSILILILQLPVLIAIYRVFLGGFSTEWLDGLYSFIARPEHLNTTLFGIVRRNAWSATPIRLLPQPVPSTIINKSLFTAKIASPARLHASNQSVFRFPLPQVTAFGAFHKSAAINAVFRYRLASIAQSEMNL
jgi:hypothetical protein